MPTDAVTPDGRARVLADGNEIPLVGLGVWQVDNDRECVDAVRWALEPGYRHIDTAQAYGNEECVGLGLRESGVPRGEVFITTKFFPGRKDPVIDQGATGRNEDAAEDQGAEHPQTQHAPLEHGGHAERGEQQDEGEDVVHAERLLQQVADEVLAGDG